VYGQQEEHSWQREQLVSSKAIWKKWGLHLRKSEKDQCGWSIMGRGENEEGTETGWCETCRRVLISLDVTISTIGRVVCSDFCFKISHGWGKSKMATGTQPQTFWLPWSRDFDRKLETHLIEVQHQGELKHQYSEPLAHGRPLHATIY
jgi:hypothetical protein